MGLVQGASCRVDLEFKDSEGKPYQKTATVKLKTETEELPLFTNKDDILGEVGACTCSGGGIYIWTQRAGDHLSA